MVLRYFIIFTAITICIKGHPSRLKILPGLAFYRTEENSNDDSDNLMDKDKDLLKSMWSIVDKMDNKVHGSPRSSPNQQDQLVDDATGGRDPIIKVPRGNGQVVQGASGTPPGNHGRTGPGGKGPPLGTPITTINVYSTYPAQAVKGEAPFTTTYTHAIPPYHNSFSATPFSSSSELGSRSHERYNQNNIPNPSPSYDVPKTQRNPFDPFAPPGNQVAFDSPVRPPHDSLITQAQYESLINSNGGIGQGYDNQMENNESVNRMYDATSSQDEMVSPYSGATIGMENPAGSAPLHFLMPQGDPNAPMRINDMLPDNYQTMGSHMHF